MTRAVFSQILAFVVALSLIVGGLLPATAFAQAAVSAAGMQSVARNDMTPAAVDSAQSTPCDSMPCHCLPGKGDMPDCAQMCLFVNALLALENPGFAVVPQLSNARADWPVDGAARGLSIKPDPFPPKRLIPA